MARQFDGIDDTIISTNTVPEGVDITLCCWFRTTVASGKKIVGLENSNNPTTAGNYYHYHLYVDTAGKLVWGYYDGQIKTIQSINLVTDGQWHFALGTIAPNIAMKLFLDGVLQGTLAIGKYTSSAQYYWRLGSLKSWSASGYWPGAIAMVLAWNVVLSDNEIEYLHKNRFRRFLPPRPQNLLLYYILDEQSGNILDWSGKRNTGNSYGTVWVPPPPQLRGRMVVP